MAGWIWAEKVLSDTRRLRVIAYETTSVLSGPGCHCKIVVGAGVFYVRGISHINHAMPNPKSLTIGDLMPSNEAALTHDPFRPAPGATHQDLVNGVGTRFGNDVTDQLIADMLYKKQAERYSMQGYGAIVFSDRVNRGSAISPSLLYKFGTAACSTAGFAKYLADHPEYGTMFSSPIFHNPNHTKSTDWSLCQIWTWFPKTREGRFYVDEAQSIGIGPDAPKYKKADVLKKFKSDTGLSGATEEHIKVTYDEPQEPSAQAGG